MSNPLEHVYDVKVIVSRIREAAQLLVDDNVTILDNGAPVNDNTRRAFHADLEEALGQLELDE